MFKETSGRGESTENMLGVLRALPNILYSLKSIEFRRQEAICNVMTQ